MSSLKTIAQNKKAHHDYFIRSLTKQESSCSAQVNHQKRRVNLKDAGAQLLTAKFSSTVCTFLPMSTAIFSTVTLCVCADYMHKKEINKLYGTVKQRVIYTISLYFKDSRVKLQFGFKGKKLYDKREDMAKRSAKRDIERAIKSSQDCFRE